MKTAKINILGQEHTLCFSARVTRRCTEDYGSVEQMLATLEDENSGRVLDSALWMLAAMLDAGRRYALRAEDREESVVTLDDLYDLFGINDLGELTGKLLDAITNGSSREVEAEPKNVKATQAAAKEAKASRG